MKVVIEKCDSDNINFQWYNNMTGCPIEIYDVVYSYSYNIGGAEGTKIFYYRVKEDICEQIITGINVGKYILEKDFLKIEDYREQKLKQIGL